MSSLSKLNRTEKSVSAFGDDVELLWKDFLSIDVKETVISCFLWKIVNESNGRIGYCDFRRGTDVKKATYSKIINGGCRPEPEILQKLSASMLLTDEQRKKLLSMCNGEHISLLLDALKSKNIRLDGQKASVSRDPRNAIFRKDGLISSAEFSKIKRGCLCNFTTALKLCFGLHCTVAQSEELLAAYGYCWQHDEKSEFLRDELAKGRHSAIDVLYDWELCKRKSAAA